MPENDVIAAADAVLERGERPTVERVPLELGRGSPVRFGSLLDQWWARLAGRLSGESHLPALPGEVSQAFVASGSRQFFWRRQLPTKQWLSNARCYPPSANSWRWSRTRRVMFRRSSASKPRRLAGRQAAEPRLADLELLLVQRQTEIEDLHQQREHLSRERGEAQQNS